LNDVIADLPHLEFRVLVLLEALCSQGPYDARRRGDVRLSDGAPVEARHLARRIRGGTRALVQMALDRLCRTRPWEVPLVIAEDGVYHLPWWRGRQQALSAISTPNDPPDSTRNGTRNGTGNGVLAGTGDGAREKRDARGQKAVAVKGESILTPPAVPPERGSNGGDGRANGRSSHRARCERQRPETTRLTEVQDLEAEITRQRRLGNDALADELQAWVARKRREGRHG